MNEIEEHVVKYQVATKMEEIGLGRIRFEGKATLNVP